MILQLSLFYQDKIDELAIMENYGQNTTSSENNKYSMLQKDLNRFYTPFNSIDDTMADNIIVSEKVNTNITAIVDNLENFYSSVKGTKYVHEKINNLYLKHGLPYNVIIPEQLD